MSRLDAHRAAELAELQHLRDFVAQVEVWVNSDGHDRNCGRRARPGGARPTMMVRCVCRFADRQRVVLEALAAIGRAA